MKNIPVHHFLDRMGAVMDYFIDEVETLRGRT